MLQFETEHHKIQTLVTEKNLLHRQLATTKVTRTCSTLSQFVHVHVPGADLGGLWGYSPPFLYRKSWICPCVHLYILTCTCSTLSQFIYVHLYIFYFLKFFIQDALMESEATVQKLEARLAQSVATMSAEK